MHGDQAADLSALVEGLDHIGQRRVAEAITVIREEDLFVFDEMLHRDEPLANVAPDAGVDQRDAPFGRLLTKNLDFLAMPEANEWSSA
jgi:hypothetical protein